MITDPRTEYLTRLQARQASLAVLEQRHLRLGNIRIAVFLAAVAAFFAAFLGQALSGWWLLVPVGVLIVVGRRLEHLEKHIARLLRATAFYERGLARLDHRWAGSGDDGGRFLDEGHLYAADLDIVGEGSLFQMLSAARTERGIETLAAWLLNRAPLSTIASRQHAVRELATRLDLREDLAISGDRAPADGSAAALVAWGERAVSAPTFAARALSGIISLLGLGAVIAGVTYLLASFGLFALTDLTMIRLQNYFVIVASVCFFTHWTARTWTEPIVEQVFRAEHDLGLLADVLERLEREAFTSPYLSSLHAALLTDGAPASSRIARLKTLASLLGARRNELMKIIGPLLLWDVHVSRAVEDWRRQSGTAINGWLNAVGEFEAIASMAGFAWEHPANVFPEFVEGTPLFDADGVYHPLLPSDRAVANNVQLNADLRVLVVSGSNMSGKSTLLRTMGVNAVLAQAGSPVSATRLRMSPLVVGASIRIQDSLQEGTSRFYAEISRLSRIMESSLGAVPVLFLIDEFLHGTNSHDRLIGAEAVVRGLADRGAIGLITTHDLALTRLVETLGSRADNVHFQDYLENGRMRFDYHMRPGVVQHSNALALMRSVGLDV